MINPRYPPCPHCGSDNVLPFEEEGRPGTDLTLFILIVLALGLITGYFLLILASYLAFPLVVLVGIIIAAKLAGKRDRKPKKTKPAVRDYMCLDCSGFFRK